MTNAIERLHEEFKRRIKTQTVCHRPTQLQCCLGFVASGQINMRKWMVADARLAHGQPIDLAA